ncbi:regulatory protein RecX [Marinimicrobium sp. ARAG 43.8]|uniref:regulatory protein RecX n=1 Tax=Marinimicrobium sp. ARAG 43.8 TaxID=3418719 RepID=UPI003CFB4CB3
MDEVKQTVNTSDIRLAAMNLLARREHSRAELHEKLSRRFSDTAMAEQLNEVLERLKEQSLQSDERFAEAFVRSRESQGKGPMRIMQELRFKGVDDSLIDACLDDRDERWWALAREVRVKRFGDQPVLSPKDKAKQARFLQYRGFSPEQARDAIASAPRHPSP